MRQIPAYRVERATWASRFGAAVLLAVAVALLTLPLWSDAGQMRLVVEMCYFLALAQAWNLLAGYAGLVSVGQQAFVGLGSYSFITATMFLGLPPLAALPLAGLVAAAIALPCAFIVFRLRGAYFAIGTWVLAEAFRNVFTIVQIFGAGTGLSLPVSVVRAIAEGRSAREIVIYYIGVALGIGAVLLVFLWLRTRQGLALTAIRDSEAAAASVGINHARTKLAVYMIAALVAGMVGALVLLEKLRITPQAAFSVNDWAANVIFIVVIGGIGSVEGPIIGTLVFFVLRSLLADFGAWYLITLGVIAVIVMLKAPRGIWGLIAERFDIHFFPVQRRLRLEAASAPPVRTVGAASRPE